MSTTQQRVAAGLASRVRAERAQRRWTLNELATLTGVSRRLLVQIERGEANPSLGTLLKLAAGLGITLTELLTQESPARPVGVIPGADAMPLWSTKAGSVARLLVSRGPLELWSWTLAAGDQRDSDPHRPGSVELLTVHAGVVTLEVGDDHVEVVAGDSAWFDATSRHAYINPGTIEANFMLSVLEPA